MVHFLKVVLMGSGSPLVLRINFLLVFLRWETIKNEFMKTKGKSPHSFLFGNKGSRIHPITQIHNIVMWD